MRTCKRAGVLFALLVLSASVCPVSAASQPIDPLRRPASSGGSIEIALGAHYHPRFEETVVPGSGGPEIERRVRHAAGIELALNYPASPHLSFTVARSWNGQVAVSERMAPSAGYWTAHGLSRVPAAAVSVLGVTISPWPDHALDPAIRLQFTAEGAATLGLSASAIWDPVVVSGRVGVVKSPGEAPALELSVGAGFVANNRVSFGASMSHATAPGTARPPTTVFTARVGYALRARSAAEIGVTASLYVGGNAPSAGFGVYWQGEAFSW